MDPGGKEPGSGSTDEFEDPWTGKPVRLEDAFRAGGLGDETPGGDFIPVAFPIRDGGNLAGGTAPVRCPSEAAVRGNVSRRSGPGELAMGGAGGRLLSAPLVGGTFFGATAGGGTGRLPS